MRRLRKAFRGFVALAFFVAFTNVEVAVKATGYPAGGDPTREATSKARLEPSYPYKFEALSDTPYQVIETEVLVIGSGAGGGVVSSQLAIKGHKVLVVDKGMYIPAEQLSGTSPVSVYSNRSSSLRYRHACCRI